jgi:NADH-ubiquinone oxidoreductase chain 4
MVLYILSGVRILGVLSLGPSFFMGSLGLIDFLAFLLIILSFLLGGMIIGGRWRVKILRKNRLMFVFLCLAIVWVLVATFRVFNLMYFYVFFEAGLIPIFLLILGWGYQPERLQAGIYMLFYTLFASLPLLVVLLMHWDVFRRVVDSSGRELLAGPAEIIFVLAYVMAFLVKLPMFCFHLWLPKAHVEAPVAGSMILAGVLLKLGRYGLWRILNFIFSLYYTIVREILVIFGLVGGLLMSFVCLVQVDIKALVAYSSIVHMGLLLGGIRTLMVRGYVGGLCMIVGHGVVSSGLFYLVGCMFDRRGRRRLLVGRGIIMVFPCLTIF